MATSGDAIRHLWTHKTQDHPWLADEELVIDRGEGAWVWTEQGKKLIDGFAISVYLPGELPASFGITGRYSRQTHYISPPGDFASAVEMPVGKLTDDWYFVCGVDVLAAPETGGSWSPATR